jgi:hypothetical protein
MAGSRQLLTGISLVDLLTCGKAVSQCMLQCSVVDQCVCNLDALVSFLAPHDSCTRWLEFKTSLINIDRLVEQLSSNGVVC